MLRRVAQSSELIKWCSYRGSVKDLQQKLRHATNTGKANVDHHEQIIALEQAHKRTIKQMTQSINAKTRELQKLQEETKAQRLVMETTRLKQELKQRELAIDFLKKRSSNRYAVNKELVSLLPMKVVWTLKLNVLLCGKPMLG